MDSIPQISGLFPAAMTMFTEDGTLDDEGTARHVDFLIRNGAHGIITAGTSGEFVAMTNEERQRVIRTAIDAAAKRVPVYAGTGHPSTRFTIKLTQAAEKMGADGVIIIQPYYQKPPKPAIIEHFHAVRRETGLPIMLYNNPHYAGCVEFTSREVARLAEDGVIQSVKSTFESVVPVHDLLYLCGDKLRVFYGSFNAPMEAFFGGAHGWVTGFLNLFIKECGALYQACTAGDIGEARRIWNMLLPFKHLYTHQLLGPINDLAIYRAGLEMLGEHGGWSRPPFNPLTDAQRATLRQMMQKAGMLA
jgi:4-hydroxy-tetrahydrodipicolinate synthase